jgi:hypothetical protein
MLQAALDERADRRAFTSSRCLAAFAPLSDELLQIPTCWG